MIHKRRNLERWLWASVAMLSRVAVAGGPMPEPDCGWTLTALGPLVEVNDFAVFDARSGPLSADAGGL
jgi:hypothetical protein